MRLIIMLLAVASLVTACVTREVEHRTVVEQQPPHTIVEQAPRTVVREVPVPGPQGPPGPPGPPGDTTVVVPHY